MDPKHPDAETPTESLPDRDLQDAQARELSRRQQAASYLKAARMTDDPAERESLRRKAAELLTPHRRPVTPAHAPGPEAPPERPRGR
jgi:hypothetical protein